MFITHVNNHNALEPLKIHILQHLRVETRFLQYHMSSPYFQKMKVSLLTQKHEGFMIWKQIISYDPEEKYFVLIE